MEPVQNDKGEWVIPASRRSDGTWRKEVVVKAGFVPQDEMKAYETTALKMKNKGIPGLPPQLQKGATKPQIGAASSKNKLKSVITTNSTKSSHKTPVIDEEVSIVQLSIDSIDPNASSEIKVSDPVKRLKALRKKLREIDDIEKKSVTELTPEQAEKLNRKSAIEEEIISLESQL